MTKAALIDQAVKGYFGIQAARFAGMSDVDAKYDMQYTQAVSRLLTGYGMTIVEVGAAIRDARKVSFYNEFAREVLGTDAIEPEVAA